MAKPTAKGPSKTGKETGMATPDESGEDDGDHGNAALVLDDDHDAENSADT